MATQPNDYVQKTFYTLTSRVPARRAELEADGWVYVSSEVVDRPPVEGETTTALVMMHPM